MKKRFDTVRFAELTILFALVLVLQIFFGQIVIGSTGFSVVLIPITLGSVLLGPWSGAFLGFTFGVVTLLSGVFGTDAFAAVMFHAAPLATSFLCLCKGFFAGLVPGLLYRLIRNKSEWLAVIIASISAPIVNTGLFILISLTLQKPVIEANYSTDVLYFLLITCAGVNFIVELIVNAVLSPVVFRIVKVFGSSSPKRKGYLS